MDAGDIIEKLDLKPHPEGGFYRETWRSQETIPAGGLPERYGGTRSLGTAIYYLLTADTFSSFHRLKSDEVFHFYAGDPVRMVNIHPDSGRQVIILGPDIERGQVFQHVVRRGIWQGACLSEGGSWALMGCTVAPGFDFMDYEQGARDELLEQFPGCEEDILRLTRPDK